MNKRYGFASVLVLLLLLTACGQRGPLRSYTKGEELVYYDFTGSDQFEQGTYGSASLLIRDGKYRIDVREGDNEIWWGQWGEIYDNVVIEVDVEQLSERPENAYGVMCRVRGRVGQTALPADLPTAEPIPDLDATAEATDAAADTTPEADETAVADEATSEVATEAADDATESAGDEDAVEAVDETVEPPETESADEEADEAATDATDEVTDEVAPDATDEATESAEEEVTQTPLQTEPDVTAEATVEATADSTLEPLPATVLEPSNGDGYLFLIQGGGSFGIFRARGRDLTPLVNWQISDAVNPGPAQNHLRAVCMNDYLALYVNDRLVAETTDDTYQRGQVGLAASAASRLGVVIEFDNLSVSEAIPG